MLGEKMTKAVREIADEIRGSKEYLELESIRKTVKSSPETSERIERARDIQKRLMEIPEEEMNSDYVESLQNEYEEISENTAVFDYFRAESAFVTMLQEVLGSIIENVDIDV